jgi:hypothetical protein
MPSRRIGRTRTLAPLDVAALWQIKRIGNRRCRRTAVARPVVVRDGDRWSNASCGCSHGHGRDAALAAREGGPPRRLTAGDKDSEPRWSPMASDRLHAKR